MDSKPSPAPKPAELTNFITYRLARVQARLNRQATRILRQKAGLSLVQWRVIALLKAHGAATASEVTGYFDMDKGLFSRNVKTLIAAGLIKRQTNPDDQREHQLELTVEGLEKYDQVFPTMQRRQQHLLHDLSAEQQALLFDAIDKINTNSAKTVF